MEDMGLPSKDQILKAVDNQYRIQIARFWCSINWLQPDFVYQHHVGFYASILQCLSFNMDRWLNYAQFRMMIKVPNSYWPRFNRQPDPWISCSNSISLRRYKYGVPPGTPQHVGFLRLFVCLDLTGQRSPTLFLFVAYIINHCTLWRCHNFGRISSYISLRLRLMETWRPICVRQLTWSKLKYEMQHWHCIYIYMCGYVDMYLQLD